MTPTSPHPAAPPPAQWLEAADRLTRELDEGGLWWLSGYAAGLASRGAAQQAVPAPAPRAEAVAAARLTIVYGSQTGNARRVAAQLEADARQAGLAVRLLRADAYPVRELKDERHLALVISTQGDGDPPDDARGLHEFLMGRRAPRLEQLNYAVLGLGDSSYPRFCAVGEALDARLDELGARRLLPRGDADLDIDAVAAPWRSQALAALKDSAKDAPRPLATVTPLRVQAPAPSAPTREAPFAATVLAAQRITASGSSRDIRHLELSLKDAGLHYQPGDALGVWPRNAPALVEAVLDALRLDGETAVGHGGQSLPLREWLSARRELTRLARPFLAAHAERAGDDALARARRLTARRIDTFKSHGDHHAPVRQHPRHHRQHAHRQARPRGAAARLALRQGRGLQPGRLGQGPPRAGDRARRRAQRRAAAGADDRRSDLRQHRRRTGDGGRRARLSVRRGDGGLVLARTPQADARLRRQGDPDARRRAHHGHGAPCRGACAAARLVPRQAVRESRQPRLAPQHHRGGNPRRFRRGRLDYFVSGWGTGGTLTGVGQVLKLARPEVRIVAAEPAQASLLGGAAWQPHKVQGWTPDFVPPVLDRDVVGEIRRVDDDAARDTARRLAAGEGIFAGLSAGATLAAALQVAEHAPAGSVLLAMLPDTGERYLSTFLFEGVNEGSDEDWLDTLAPPWAAQVA